MVTDLTQLGYVNNYDKNRYLEKISKAAVDILASYIKGVYLIPFHQDKSAITCV